MVLAILVAGSANAEVKSYDSNANNGSPGDQKRISINLCPPVVITANTLLGYQKITDNGTGTVTLDHTNANTTQITDLSGDLLVPVFGPGAFIFIDGQIKRKAGPTTSNTSGIGGHGPSGTGPGQSAEWGVVSGWTSTGFQFCISSPITICNQNGFSHGATTGYILPSTTYNLGTWNFDAEGDMQSSTWFLIRTSNGGLSNNHYLQRGAFVGAALPALPIVGFGILALGLAVVGGRAIAGKK
jgi:hypothetical protein